MKLELDVSDEVLAERKAKWQPKGAEGYNRLFEEIRSTCYIEETEEPSLHFRASRTRSINFDRKFSTNKAFTYYRKGFV